MVGGAARQAQIAEIQRTRLFSAAARAVDELGYAHATVGEITDRARVSRRTFYELFANREECLLAVLQDTIARVRSELLVLELERLDWRGRVRTGLWAILSFLDREPALARVCVVQVMRGGPALLACREQLLEQLAGALDEGSAQNTRQAGLSRLTAEGLVSAALGIVHSRLLRAEPESLCSLQGELMAMIMLPYLGAAAARRELTHPAPTKQQADTGAVRGDPLQGLQMRITYRTARVLEGAATHPGASNRQLAEHAGIQDQGQVSKLLGRLQRLGLIANQGAPHAKGEPNAWTLTPRGEQLTQSISARAQSAVAQSPRKAD